MVSDNETEQAGAQSLCLQREDNQEDGFKGGGVKIDGFRQRVN